MDERTPQEKAIELLGQLGLKEYEAKSLVALARRQSGTAKDISETSDVPRTRVYDAVRVLESKGLVETQHSNPKVFRAVPIDEAVATLQTEYRERAESLREALGSLDAPDPEVAEATHEVWALSDRQGIRSRTQQLIDDADNECILVLGDEGAVTEELLVHLRAARERGVSVIVGTVSEELRDRIRADLPDIELFVSGLEWLTDSSLEDDETQITRLMLVDREAILVSSFTAHEGRTGDEHGVFGHGFDNGLVAIGRRLMGTGFIPADSAEAD